MKNFLFILFLFLSVGCSAQFGNNNPNIFNLKNFKGIGDARQVFDGVTNGTTTITSATANFTSADVNKIIRIPRGTSSTKAFVGTISSVSNSTTVILNSAAAATTSADTVVLGTDNTNALDSAISACNQAGGGVIFIPAGWYLFGGQLITSYYGTNPNAQIPWPVTSFDSSSGVQNQFTRRRFIIEGEATGLISLPVNGGPGAHPAGATILETIIDGSTSGGQPASFFGTKSPDAGNFNLNANEITFDDLIIEVPTNEEGGGPLIGGINAFYSAGTSVENTAIVIDGLGQSSSKPINDVAGLVLNEQGGELVYDVNRVAIAGFKYGLVTADHATIKDAHIYWCNFGRVYSRQFDGSEDQHLNVQWCSTLLYLPNTPILGGMLTGASSGGVSKYSYVKIDQLDAEIYTSGSKWYQSTPYVIVDSGDVGRITGFYSIAVSGLGLNPATQNVFNKYLCDSCFMINVGKPLYTPPANNYYTLTGTTGDLFAFSGTNTQGDIAAVAAGSLLASNGTSTLPAWSAAPTLTTSLTVPNLYGGVGSAGNLILNSTSNATKGKIYFGASGGNNYFNEAKGNIILNQTAAVNAAFAAYESDLTGGGALYPALLLVNTNTSSPGGSQYNIASVTLGAGNSAVVGQFAANYGSGATAPFVTQGFVIATRTNDPLLFAPNSTLVAQINGTGFSPTTTITSDLGTSSLAWRDLYYSHTISESAIGASSSLGTNVTSVTPSGSDEDFQLIVVSATGGVAGSLAQIAFGRTWIARPHCLISTADAVTGTAVFAGAGSYISLNAVSTSALQLSGNWVAAGTYTFNCHCGN